MCQVVIFVICVANTSIKALRYLQNFKHELPITRMNLHNETECNVTIKAKQMQTENAAATTTKAHTIYKNSHPYKKLTRGQN